MAKEILSKIISAIYSIKLIPSIFVGEVAGRL